jgi:hypothetical protein
MLRFRNWLNYLEIKEIQLTGKNTHGLILSDLQQCQESTGHFALPNERISSKTPFYMHYPPRCQITTPVVNTFLSTSYQAKV